MNKAALLMGGLLSGIGAALAPAQAETLQDALAMAVRSNPNLRGQQALQRAAKEDAAQARSGWRPVVTATLNGGYLREPFDTFNYAVGTGESNDAEALLTVRQPLYTGGRIAHAARAAETRVQAGQRGLQRVEAQTLQSVVIAYMDVLRDQDILEVRRADLSTLAREVAETTARYRLGAQVTFTDVAQARAQRQAAAASLDDASAQLAASRANFRAVVGSSAKALVPPEALPNLPETLNQALVLAEAHDPALAQSRLAARAAREDVATARAAYWPTISLQGSVGYIGPATPFRANSYDREVVGLVTLTQPLVTGGLIASQVRQAKDRAEAAEQTVDTTDRQAVQIVSTAWNQVQHGLHAIRANQAQVRSATTALRGYQLEYDNGLRSTLDVLIADQNLRAAQVSLARSQHDTIVAEATLQTATGRLAMGFHQL